MEGDDLDQDKVQPILSGRTASLTIKDVEHLLIYREKNTQMPFLPKGGEVYIFQPEKEIESRDWVSDGHSFSCEGTRKVRGNTGDIKKYYYQLHIGTEGKKRITDKRFRKEVYVPLSPEYKNIAVLHYIGDASISKPKAHGNSKKQTMIFVRPKPSAIKLIEENVKANTDKSAHKVYKEALVNDAVKSVVTDIPRNVRQVHYIKEKVRTDARPTKDALINLQAMAYEDQGFVHYIATFPDLIAIIGMEQMIAELNESLQLVPKKQQLLSYDTTFSMGDFYVSALLFKRKRNRK